MSAASIMAARWKQLSSGSLNRRIFSAAVIVGGLTFAGKLVAMLKEMMVAAWFGTGDSLDAFLVAFVLPSYAINVIAGCLDAALIPTLVAVREKEGPVAAQRLFSGTMVLTIAFLSAATLLLAALAPWLLPLLCSGFDEAKLNLTLHLFYWFLPGILLTGLAIACEAALNAGEKFAVAAFAPCVVSLALMASLALFGARFGVQAMAVGMVVGFLLQLAIVAWALSQRGSSLVPRWSGYEPALRQVVKQYLPAMASAGLMCSTQVVDQSMASMLPAGSVSSLNYANKFVSLLLGIGTMALGTAVLPYFSQLVAAANWPALRHTLKTYLGLIVLVTIPLVAGGIFLSKPLVALLFQRGHFTASDTAGVAWVQSMFLLQLPFYTFTILFVRMISSLQANHVLLWGTVISVVLNITLNYVLMQFMGAAGIALSTSIVYVVLSCFLGMVLWKRLQRLSS
jgi:putative peptidoglycan lipid II flippase